MPKYAFYTVCPVCLEGKKYYWEHAKDSGDIYIWHDCDLQCNDCSEMSFILNWRFNCNTSKHNTFKEIDAFNVIAAISEVTNIPNLPSEVRLKMLGILKNRL